MVRRLVDDFRDFPATMTLCSLWVIVFALMVLHQMGQGHVPNTRQLQWSLRGGHPFGELTIRDLFQGEIWRPLTATFVHYGLLHLGMNLYIMYHLGALVETWYGPWQFLLVYVVIGTAGNVLSAFVRLALGSDQMAASGGGSTVVLGLVALCAVVGWRSHTKTGAFLKSQMLGLLIATAILGQMIPIIDNWGHAGGAFAGALVGFAHRTLIRTAHQPVAKWLGTVGMLILIAAAVAQWGDSRAEASALQSARSRLLAGEQTVQTLEDLKRFYRFAAIRWTFEHVSLSAEILRRAESETFRGGAAPRPSSVKPLSLLDSSDAEFRAELKRQLDRLDALRGQFASDSAQADFKRLRLLLSRVLNVLTTEQNTREFNNHANMLIRSALRDKDRARADLEALGHRVVPRSNVNQPARSPTGRPAGGGDARSPGGAPSRSRPASR